MSAVLQERETNVIDMESGRVTIDLPVTSEMRGLARNAGALALAQSYEVDCAELAQVLADERVVWAQRIDAIEAMEKDFMSPVKKAVEDMKAKVQKWFGATKADYIAARDLAGQKLLAWDQKERARIAKENAEREAAARKIRQEAEAKAAAEIARAEEQRREHMKREAEALAAKQKAHAEGNAKAAAAAAAAEAKAREAAQAALENGHARAAAVQVSAAAAVSATPPAEQVKIAGQSIKENWMAVLKDGETEDSALEQIVAAIAGVQQCGGRLDLLAHLKLDTAARGSLNKQAAALKERMNVPGFVARDVPALAGSRGK